MEEKKVNNVVQWGEAPKDRAQKFNETAEMFLKDFPIGTTLSQEQLDRWFAKNKLTPVPFGAPPDEWYGYVQRRNRMRRQINRAATHPRMATPYTIEPIGGGEYEVRNLRLAITKNGGPILTKTARIMETKIKQLNTWMQGIIVDELMPQEQMLLLMSYKVNVMTAKLAMQNAVAAAKELNALVSQKKQPAKRKK